ncbi:MAG TPA: mercury transporter [Chryseobacterium sp.]|nr:mercury transporter [Chryseobacterium sp.]
MKSISKILMVITVLLSSVNSFAQIKNVKSETVKIYGNCEMCKTTIEKAGNVKNVATVDWNKDTKMATLNYDSKKTNQDEILKRIALAGYDSEKYLAPDDVYAKLSGCCQYNRELKPVATTKDSGMDMKAEHANHNPKEMSAPNMVATQNAPQLKAVFDNYFSVKDALVKTDAGTSSAKAVELVKAIKAVEMTKLSNEEHTVWMKVMKELTANAEKIAASKDVAKQREIFALLSKNMYELAKVSKQETPVYYQHCPMYNNGKGANWLSKEEAVKNPYYGSQMLNCGSVQETIK